MLIRSDDQEGSKHGRRKATSRRPGQDSVGRSGEDKEAQVFAEKFNISLAMARRLVELHRTVLERELKKPKKR
jgi:ActR/RegA family two-component response regulator